MAAPLSTYLDIPATMRESPEPFRFLDLPLELRLMVYEYLPNRTLRTEFTRSINEVLAVHYHHFVCPHVYSRHMLFNQGRGRIDRPRNGEITTGARFLMPEWLAYGCSSHRSRSYSSRTPKRKRRSDTSRFKKRKPSFPRSRTPS
jgi:hypothetical protein